ncbi:hypothetical protein LEP1GSC107_3291 [Leptospira interrogans serovar Grippotyphosa str. UI 12769]|nr:hypothetical protein LEP1GSC089_3612 [Leptospira interrogans serovar Autumnalis str. LP101]EMN85020.1 hypothetical protein LEP1GSC107_3291 [Leptospira interrogans serovar Grippotyphosa str. UI 12769]
MNFLYLKFKSIPLLPKKQLYSKFKFSENEKNKYIIVSEYSKVIFH